jgi:hypothetical protein
VLFHVFFGQFLDFWIFKLISDSVGNNRWSDSGSFDLGHVGGELRQDKNPHKVHQSAKRDTKTKSFMLRCGLLPSTSH